MQFVDPKRKAEVHEATAQYIRLAGKTDDDYLAQVGELLMSPRYWSMDPPQLLIEVAGTATELTGVSERLAEKFKRGLMKAAESADAWLVTAGSNDGVMRLVGDAVAKARRLGITLTCLGITSWGVVANRHQLEFTPRSAKQPVPYDVAEAEMGVSLNYGHNFYLLVDNGIEERYGEEIAFRAAVLHYITQKASLYDRIVRGLSGTSDTPVIPRVLLVVGGGPNTLRQVKLATCGTQDHPLALNPVVALAGFGGVGDLLCHAYRYLAYPSLAKFRRRNHSNDNGNKENPDVGIKLAPKEFFIEMTQHPAFGRLVDRFNTDSLDEEHKQWEVVNDLYECCSNLKLITVVDLSKSEPVTLDSAILNAIFKARLFRNQSSLQILQLARRWDLVHVARDIVQRSYGDLKTIDYKSFIQLLELAIICGQHEMYELITDYKLVNLVKFLSPQQIIKLYQLMMSKLAYPGTDPDNEQLRQPKNPQLLRCVKLLVTMLTMKRKKNHS